MCVDSANCDGNCSECQYDTIKRLRVENILRGDKLVKAASKIVDLRAELTTLRARVQKLEAAHRNILIHTAYLPCSPASLLRGLLDSCERIARAALTEKGEG